MSTRLPVRLFPSLHFSPFETDHLSFFTVTVLLTVAWPSLLWLEFVMAAFVPLCVHLPLLPLFVLPLTRFLLPPSRSAASAFSSPPASSPNPASRSSSGTTTRPSRARSTTSRRPRRSRSTARPSSSRARSSSRGRSCASFVPSSPTFWRNGRSASPLPVFHIPLLFHQFPLFFAVRTL